MKFKTLLLFLFWVNVLPEILFARIMDESISSGMHLCFLENKGQVTDQYGQQRADIQFKLGSPGFSVFIGSGSIHYQWNRVTLSNYTLMDVMDALPGKTSIPQSSEMYRMDVELIGANKKAKVIAESRADYYERYYLPQFGENGSTAYSYQKIIYQNIYPHIDWVLYVKDGKLEYDFVVRPGGRVSDIRFKYDGATSLRINDDGSLTAKTPVGEITEQAPYSFQEDGKKIYSNFSLKDNLLCFIVDDYEGVLTIDPTLEWITYYGGTGSDFSNNLVCDAMENIYMIGMTQGGNNIVTTGSYQSVFGGGAVDAYLVKFNASGIRLWATYYGGNNYDEAIGIAYDHKKSIYICGSTESTSGVATTGGHQTAISGDQDAFLVKFDTSGLRHWATYYGGKEAEDGIAVALDLKGNVYMQGTTRSTAGISTLNSYQEALGGGADNFLVKFDSTGIRLWGTYYGGTGNESSGSISCDLNNNIYIAGRTPSNNNIATSNGFQTVKNSTTTSGTDVYLAKFNDLGIRLWATYYGGAMNELMLGGNLLTNDNSGNVYFGFHTQSTTDIATSGSHKSVLTGRLDCALVKFDSMGNRQWATYYGGNDPAGRPDQLSAVICNEDNIYITGYTGSADEIATLGQNTTLSGPSDAFLAKFNTDGALQWGTYFGGIAEDYTTGIANSIYGSIYLSGGTSSPDLPTESGSFQNTFGGTIDGFLVKYCGFATLPFPIFGADTVCPNSVNTYSVPDIDGAAYFWSVPPGWNGTSNSHSITITTDRMGGIVSVSVIRCNDTSNMQTLNIHTRVLDPVITIKGFELGTTIPYVSYQWLLNGNAIPDATNSTYSIMENGNYQVRVINENGCIDTSDIYTVTNYTKIGNADVLSESIQVYPNPSWQTVRIQSSFPVNVSINGVDGRILLQKNNVGELDIKDLSAGLYILNLSDAEGTLLKIVKLIKL